MKTEIDIEYSIIFSFTMAFTPSIAILFLLIVVGSIATEFEQNPDVIVHEGMFVISKRSFQMNFIQVNVHQIIYSVIFIVVVVFVFQKN